MLHQSHRKVASSCSHAQSFSLTTLASCQKTETTAISKRLKIDACGLITSEEVQAIQGSPIKDVKGSENSDGSFRVAQCFYSAETFNKSVSLAVPPKKMQGIGDAAYWTANRMGGALYVSKKDVFIRVSVGGPESEKAKIERCKALAEKALSRL